MPRFVVEMSEVTDWSIGGLPLAPLPTVWPTCRSCGNAMQFLAQLPFAEHDAPEVSARQQALLLFQCQATPGMCDEWDAEGGGNAALIAGSAERRELSVPAGETLLPGRSNTRFVPHDDTAMAESPDDAYCAAYDSAEPVLLGKIGGRPLWVQDDETPGCTCGSRMVFFAQIEERGGGGINFGGGGSGYAFVCSSCTDAAKFLFQC